MSLLDYCLRRWGHFRWGDLLFDQVGRTPAYIWHQAKPGGPYEPVGIYDTTLTPLTSFCSLTFPV